MYDFINNGDFPDDERVPYRLIRWWLLDCYYTYCRSKLRERSMGKGGGRWLPYEHELGYAYEQFELSFELPIERLMLEILTLVLNGGRGPEALEPFHRAKIAAILDTNDLTEMLNELPDAERREFEHDIRLLSILPL